MKSCHLETRAAFNISRLVSDKESALHAAANVQGPTWMCTSCTRGYFRLHASIGRAAGSCQWLLLLDTILDFFLALFVKDGDLHVTLMMLVTLAASGRVHLLGC
jgi:hypothetical protein